MPVIPPSALNTGLLAHRAGKLDQAIAIYSAILAIEYDNATARHLRGFALLQLDRLDEAADDLRTAVRLNPANANGWAHLSVCLSRRGESAFETAHRALLLQPALSEALDIASRTESAGSKPVSRLVVVAPDDPAAWSRAGLVRAAIDPNAARRALRRALVLAPGDAAPMLDLADLERRCHEPAAARRLASRSLILRPRDPRALAERAAAAVELDAVADALDDTAQALVLDPGHVQGWGNRGETLYRMADYGAAAACGRRALVAAPEDSDVRANLGAYQLARGDLAHGWPLFRSRPARRQSRRVDLPRWTGESRADLLVLAEQGLGDELLFSSMWPDLDRRVAKGDLSSVTVEADRRLISLGERACPHLDWRPRSTSQEPSDRFTHWCLAGDLLEVLRPSIDAFRGATPGLAPDADLVDGWRTWLAEAAAGRPAIGLCWRSGSIAGHRRRHYPQIGDCTPLLALENRFFVVLQYDDCGDEIADAVLGTGSDVAFPPGLDRRNDQEGVAGLMTALDLVVSADTAVLALAGALGVQALGFALHPGWVGLGQADHPWFPHVERLYRAPQTPWAQTMAAVAGRVEDRVGRGKI